MNWFKNLRISAKLITGFGIVIVLTAILASFSIYKLNEVDSGYSYIIDYPAKKMEYMFEAEIELINIRRYVLSAVLYSGEGQRVIDASDNVGKTYEKVKEALDKFETVLTDDLNVDDSDKEIYQQKLNSIRSNLTQYFSLVDYVLEAAIAGDQEYAKSYLGQVADFMTEAIQLSAEIASDAQQTMIDISNQVTAQTNQAKLLLIAASIAAVFIAIILSLIISNAVKKPIIELVNVAREVSNGNLNVNIRADTRDEVGELGRSFVEVIDNVRGLIDDTGTMHKLQ